MYLRIFRHSLVTEIFAASDMVHDSHVSCHGDHVLLARHGFPDIRQKIDENLLELLYAVRRNLKFCSAILKSVKNA